MELFEAMQPRSIGPAGMSGRVTAIDAIESDPSVIYVGTASGGLWRSKSGGVDWTPVFDEEPAHSIGAIAINQKNPDIIWVGAGEGNPRNSYSSGNGVYKSVDGGRTWMHLGLEQSRNIHRIISLTPPLRPKPENMLGTSPFKRFIAACGSGESETANDTTENRSEQSTDRPRHTTDTESDTTIDEPMIEVLTEGTGEPIEAGDTAVVHYTGWFFDESADDNRGDKFDSSRDRGEPLDFPLGAGRVIEGWDKGVEGMKPGERRILTIPPDLAYGERGYPGAIPPNSTLIFDVELVEIR